MNLQVLNLERRGVAKMDESSDLKFTQNQDVIENANTKINNLLILLDKKRAESSSLQHYTPAHAEQHTSSVDELAKVYEVIDLYNEVISIYLGNNSVQTKQIVGSSVRRLFTYVAPIARSLLHMIKT